MSQSQATKNNHDDDIFLSLSDRDTYNMRYPLPPLINCPYKQTGSYLHHYLDRHLLLPPKVAIVVVVIVVVVVVVVIVVVVVVVVVVAAAAAEVKQQSYDRLDDGCSRLAPPRQFRPQYHQPSVPLYPLPNRE